MNLFFNFIFALFAFGFLGNIDNNNDYSSLEQNTSYRSPEEASYFQSNDDDIIKIDTEEVYPTYTNDPSWKVEKLNYFQKDKDAKSYKCYYCEYDWETTNYAGEDKFSYYLDFFKEKAIDKKDLSGYFPLQFIGIESVDGILGYSPGYIILFPLKFPVDKDSFVMVQKKRQLKYGEIPEIMDLEEVSKGARWVKFINNGIIHDKYIGDDKDYVYFWEDFGKIIISREKKASDFLII